MTEIEAIEKIKYRIETATEIVGKGIDGDPFEDLKMAIPALEKQIPKKPRDDGLRSGIFGTNKYYTCPRCGNACLQRKANERQDNSYCWDCGQRLDWSEKE